MKRDYSPALRTRRRRIVFLPVTNFGTASREPETSFRLTPHPAGGRWRPPATPVFFAPKPCASRWLAPPAPLHRQIARAARRRCKSLQGAPAPRQNRIRVAVAPFGL